MENAGKAGIHLRAKGIPSRESAREIFGIYGITGNM
jgi:hypothetical protein